MAASAASAAIWQPAVGNYGDAANWDTAVVPGAADTAYIPNGGVANLADGGSYSLTNLYVNTETTPTVPGSTLNLTNGTLAVTGWTRTGNGSTVAIDGGTLNAKQRTAFVEHVRTELDRIDAQTRQAAVAAETVQRAPKTTEPDLPEMRPVGPGGSWVERTAAS